MSYQGFTAEDGKYEVLVELTGQVCFGFSWSLKTAVDKTEQDRTEPDHRHFVIVLLKIKNKNI